MYIYIYMYIYIKSKRGPRTKPYWATYFTEAILEALPLTETNLFSVREVGFKPFVCYMVPQVL